MSMTSAKKILLLLVISLLIPIYTHAKVYLVSVGISDYPGRSADLRLAAQDAQVVTDIYYKNGAECWMLRDSQATKVNIIATMNKVFTKAGKNDIIVLFYSGHGNMGGFEAYDGHLSYQSIRKSMAKSKSKNKMIFADTCFSGDMRTEGTASSSVSSDIRNANVMLFLSSRDNEYSMECQGMSNGLFTTFLQKGLTGDADVDNNRVITAKELFKYVHTHVTYVSQNLQHPVMWGKFSDNMPVIKWNKKK